MPERLYHIVPAAELRAGLEGAVYRAANLTRDGFVHCALRHSVLSVADDYFSGTGDELLLLEIDPQQLRSELRYEAPAPGPRAGTAHLASASAFPHVYGPIEATAIVGIGLLPTDGQGFRWPRSFSSLDEYLSRSAARRPAGDGG